MVYFDIESPEFSRSLAELGPQLEQHVKSELHQLNGKIALQAFIDKYKLQPYELPTIDTFPGTEPFYIFLMRINGEVLRSGLGNVQILVWARLLENSSGDLVLDCANAQKAKLTSSESPRP